VLSLPTADRFSLGPGGVLVHNQVALSSQAGAIRYGGRALPRTTEETRPLTEGTGTVHTPAISDDGRQVAMSRSQGEESALLVVPFDGGPGRIVAGSPTQELAPSWSPDGTRLAFIRSDSSASRLMVTDFPDGTPRRIGSANAVPGWTASLFWSADGRRVSYRVSDLQRIGLVNLAQQQESFILIPDSLGYGYTGGGMVSPDGSQMVISTIHRWNDWGELWLTTSDGRVLRRLREPFGESYPVRWTDDGWLYVINNHAELTDQGQFKLQLWRIRMPDGAPELYAPIPEGCGSLSLSRDGTRAACDLNTRQSDLVAVLGFDPDGT